MGMGQVAYEIRGNPHPATKGTRFSPRIFETKQELLTMAPNLGHNTKQTRHGISGLDGGMRTWWKNPARTYLINIVFSIIVYNSNMYIYILLYTQTPVLIAAVVKIHD